MQTGDMISAAVSLTRHADALVIGSTRISQASLEQYWSASKIRARRWGMHLQGTASLAVIGVSLAEEILAGDLLARVFAAVATTHDRRRFRQEVEPLARNVLNLQLESSNHLLRLLCSTSSRLAPAIEPRRRRIERLNDALISHLLITGDVSEFAVDPDRAENLALQERESYRPEDKDGVWRTAIDPLHGAVRQDLTAPALHAELNERICCAALATFRGEPLFSTGAPYWLWSAPFLNASHRVESLLEQLAESAAAETESGRAYGGF